MGVEARARRARRVQAEPIFRDGATLETKRQCRICKCSDDDRCWTMRSVPHPLAPQIPIQTKTFCRWVAGDLCSDCAADGGPPHIIGAGFGPECYSTLVDRFGQPILLSKYLPR